MFYRTIRSYGLCVHRTILMHAEGYRAEKNLQHYRTSQALQLILGGAGKGAPIFSIPAGANETSSSMTG
jgi:hypothetical protein